MQPPAHAAELSRACLVAVLGQAGMFTLMKADASGLVIAWAHMLDLAAAAVLFLASPGIIAE